MPYDRITLNDEAIFSANGFTVTGASRPDPSIWTPGYDWDVSVATYAGFTIKGLTKPMFYRTPTNSPATTNHILTAAPEDGFSITRGGSPLRLYSLQVTTSNLTSIVEIAEHIAGTNNWVYHSYSTFGLETYTYDLSDWSPAVDEIRIRGYHFSSSPTGGTEIHNDTISIDNLVVSESLANRAPEMEFTRIMQMNQGSTLTLDPANLLALATDPDGDALKITSLRLEGGVDRYTPNYNTGHTQVDSNTSTLAGKVWSFNDLSWSDFAAHTLRITADPTFSGTVIAYYTISDGWGKSVEGKIELTVKDINFAPVTGTGVYINAAPNVPATVSYATLLGGVFDQDGDALRVAGATMHAGSEAAGTVSLDDGTGQLVFTAASGAHGWATVDVTIADAPGATATRSLYVLVNTPTVAPAINLTVEPGTPVTVSRTQLLAGVTDADGDTLTLGNVGLVDPGVGRLRSSSSGYTFTPATGFTGHAVISAFINDGYGSVIRTIDINVVHTNVPPVIEPLTAYWMTPNATPITLDFTDLLDRASDPEGGVLTLGAVTLHAGSEGDATVTIDRVAQTITITPTGPHPTGERILLDFVVEDADGGSTTGLFGVDEVRYNASPISSGPLSVTAVAGRTLSLTVDEATAHVTDADGDERYFYLSTPTVTPVAGTLSVGFNGRVLDFTPTEGFLGHATVQVVVNDGFLGQGVAELDIEVVPNYAPATTGPVALEGGESRTDVFTVAQLAATTTDGNDDLLYVSTVTLRAGSEGAGSFVVNRAAGTVTFIPTWGFVGPVVADAVLDDGYGGSTTVELNIAVAPNTAPVASSTSVTADLHQDWPLTLSGETVVAGASDADGDDLVMTGVALDPASASMGSVSLDPGSQTLMFTPADGALGTAHLDVTVSDGRGGSTVVEVEVEVTPFTDRAPFVTQQLETVEAILGTPLNLSVDVFHDVDIGDVLTVTATLNDRSALPDWLTFDAATMTLRGTPPTSTPDEPIFVLLSAEDLSGQAIETVIRMDIALPTSLPPTPTGGREKVSVHGDQTVTQVMDADGWMIGAEIQTVSGGRTTTQFFDGTWDQLAAGIVETRADGSTLSQAFDGDWNQQSSTISRVQAGAVVVQSFDEDWTQLGATVTRDQGGRTIVQTFDATWNQVEASVTTHNGDATTVQHFDADWRWTGSTVTTVATIAGGTTTKVQEFDAAWNQMSAVITEQQGVMTAVRSFDGAWNQLGVVRTFANTDGSTMVEQFRGDWTLTDRLVTEADGDVTETVYAVGGGQIFAGSDTHALTYVFDPGDVSEKILEGFVTAALNPGAHDMLVFKGFGAGAVLQQVDAHHWSVVADGHAVETFAVTPLVQLTGADYMFA